MRKKLPQITITEQELNWLYYGDENEQIIAKLTNEENNFKEYMNIIGRAFRLENLIMTLNAINAIYEDNNKIYGAKIIQYTPTKKEIERVCYLVNKYNIVEFVNEYLEEKRIIEKRLLDLKIGIIKSISIYYNSTLIEMNNYGYKDTIKNKFYSLYSKTLLEFGYDPNVAEYRYLVNKLIKE